MFFDGSMNYLVASATKYIGDFEGCIAYLGTMQAGILCSVMGGSPCKIVVIRRYLCKIQSFDMFIIAIQLGAWANCALHWNFAYYDKMLTG